MRIISEDKTNSSKTRLQLKPFLFIFLVIIILAGIAYLYSRGSLAFLFGGSPTQVVTKFHNAAKDADSSEAINLVTDECRSRLGKKNSEQKKYLKEILSKTKFKSFTIKSEDYDGIGATVEAQLVTSEGKVNEVYFLNKVGGVWLIQDGNTPFLPSTELAYEENLTKIVEIAFNYVADVVYQGNPKKKDYDNLIKVLDEGIDRIELLNPPDSYKDAHNNLVELMKIVENNIEMGKKIFFEVKDEAEKNKIRKEQEKSIKKELELKAKVLEAMPFLKETEI